MTLLVTGGAGFIGSNFIFYQFKKYPNIRIVCMDKLTYAGNLSTLESIMKKPEFRFVQADITDRIAVEAVFSEEKPDIVVNFAAETHIDRSIDNPGIFIETNVIGTQVLLDACRKFGVKRFHQVSTDEVYGDLPFDRPDLCFTENMPIRASSPYSASKAGADILAVSYYKTFGLPVTITRCTNNYGPYHFPEKLIPLVISRAENNQFVPVYGDGKNIRDWLYVEDHCKAVDLVMRYGRAGEIYNVSGHNEKSNIEVVRAVLKKLGRPESLISFVADRPGHDRRYSVDSSKIENELGWKPDMEFNDGIEKTVEWYLENRKWWQDIITGGYADYFENMYKNRF